MNQKNLSQLSALTGEPVSRTPIEIALGIDADGNTTARKLYGFLGLEPKNYSRWCKSNITENEFAEENVDYIPFVIDEEREKFNPNPTTDYKLTSAFAKKLSMTAKNERGEEARNYFIQVEDKLKEVASKKLSPLDELELHYKAMKQIDLKVEQVDSRVGKLENTMVIDYGQQRVLERLVAGVVIMALGGKDSAAYKEIGKKVFSECNHDIKDYFDVNSRNNIPRVKFADACKYIRAWQPCYNTKMMIDQCNAQMCMA